MTTKDEALKLALEALERASNYIDHLGGVSACYRVDFNRIKEAQAQPDPLQNLTEQSEAARGYDGDFEPEHEPVALRNAVFTVLEGFTLPQDVRKILETAYFNTTPYVAEPRPKREWVGLTAQEAADCWSTSATKTWQAIEAKLKEKNT